MNLLAAPSVVQPLAPRVPGWMEIPADPRFTRGFPCRAFLHREHRFFVMSAVEVVDEGRGREPQYHVSISRVGKRQGDVHRVSGQDARMILKQFCLEGAEEDNHVEHGKARNFWRPVAEPMVGHECACKDSEPRIVEDKGDFIIRAAP